MFSRSQGLPGRGDEHQGGVPGVRAAPRHRAQDALTSRASGIPQEAPTPSPKLEPYTGVIDGILENDLSAPKKQRHTAKRIFERLRDEHGFDGGYTIVKDYYDLLVIDDLGYLPQGARESEVLFTLIAERYERRSLGITSNLVFSE